MPPGEFRLWGHRVLDWVADYLEGVGDYPILAEVSPGDVRRRIADAAPEDGEPFESLFADFKEVVVPGITHWNHPAFFAYFAMSGSGPGVLGELLAAALNVNAMVWRASPAATELEEAVVDWLRDFVGLPATFSGSINDTASTSSFTALAAARERRLPEASEGGMAGAPPGRVYVTDETHSSVAKAVRALGLGREGLRTVPCGPERGMDPEALARMLDRDVAAGARPLAAVVTLGTTSVTAVDPVARIADVARSRGVWLHVDAAYAGVAGGLPEVRSLFAGWERADSIVINPHKWFLTPSDCSVLYVRDPGELKAAFSLVPAYLETEEQGVTHLMDQGLALGRRFRALKLWFVMRYFGQRGIRELLGGHIAMARRLARAMDETPGWERRRPTPFSLVVARCAPPGVEARRRDELNRSVIERVNRSGAAFLAHTEVDGEVWIRLAIGNVHTRQTHVDAAWTALREAAAAEVGVAAAVAPRRPSHDRPENPPAAAELE